jgi:hypothetical protein
MTTERRKALIFLSLTFVAGILIGMLIPGFFSRMRREGWKERGGRQEQRGTDRRIGFQKMIYRIVKADSAQAKQIQPVLEETSVKIESLEKASNQQMMTILDSMKIRLAPMLGEEQIKRLDEFSKRNRSRRRGF